MEEAMLVETLPETEMPPKRLPWGKILGGVVLGILALAGVVYATVLKPYVVVGKSMASLARYGSAQVVYQTEDQKFKLVADVAGEEKPFTIEAKMENLSGAENSDLTVTGIFAEQEMYAQANYGDPKMVDELLVAIYPLITRTQTYKLAAPLWRGEKWLHVTLPESEDAPEVDFEWDKVDPETKKLMTDLVLAIKPGKIEKNYGYEGEGYTKVSYGFRKERLIKAINDLKDTKIDMKVSQINSLVEIVESSDDWDRDLLTFLIDKKGDLRVVLLQLPQIDEKVLQEGIAEGTSEDQTGMAVGVAGMLKGLVWREEGELVSLGSIRLGQFDQVKAPEIPTELVEGKMLWESAVSELGPIIGQMMMATSQPTYGTTGMPYGSDGVNVPTTTNPGLGRGKSKNK